MKCDLQATWLNWQGIGTQLKGISDLLKTFLQGSGPVFVAPLVTVEPADHQLFFM